MVTGRIDDVFAQAAREAPNRTHLVFEDGGTATYAQTYTRAAALAGAFEAAGIASGDRVAGFMRNSREVIEFFVACAIANVIGVALNGMSTKRELAGIFADCSPSGIVAEAGFLTRVPDCTAMRLRVATQTASPPQG
ncbi:MAG: AMP-binding protein, partial [Rhodobacteraceae bacterium]|nr:AMP-binding protein [Paracoccaceae bacterium]